MTPSSDNDSVDTFDAFSIDIPRIPLRRTEPLNHLSWFNQLFEDARALEAYPVPTVRQYANCVDAGGKSVWTDDGIWRCLLSGASPPPGLKQFTDYTKFLDYQKSLVAAASVHEPSSLNATSSLPVKFVSKDEAKGKDVVGQSSSTEAFTADDGNVEVRRRTVKYYSDGTASVETSTDSKKPGKLW